MKTSPLFIYPQTAIALLILSKLKRHATLAHRSAQMWADHTPFDFNAERNRIACLNEALSCDNVARQIEADLIGGKYACQ